MTELNFRIIVVPEKELNPREKDQILARVTATVQSCGLTAVSVQFSHVKKSEEEYYPEIEELTLEVRGKTRTPCYGSKVPMYEEFCLKWKNYFNTLPCSYVELYGNDCFVNAKGSHHRLSYHNVAFGVLPHNGKYYQYSNLQKSGIINFYHDTRNAVVEYDTFQMNFSYENIRNIFIDVEAKPSKIFFDLFNPPVIFRIQQKRFAEGKHRNLDLSPLVVTLNEIFMRKFIFNSSTVGPPMIDVDVLGRGSVLSLTVSESDDLRKVIARIHHHCSEKSVYYTSIIAVQKNKPSDPYIESIHFGCTYLITAIFKRNFVAISQTSDVNSSLRRLQALSQQNSESLEKALTAVVLALDSGKLLNFWNAIESQYRFYSSNKDEIHFKDYILPSNCTVIRRITLTPTRQLLWPAEIMCNNRVLRNFNSEYSVRVSFREDNMSRLSFNAPYADFGVLEACVKTPMSDGLRIGSRTYEFLAWSNSQIRDHGVWMYAKDTKGYTASSIRGWMGDFSHIRNVPKYMSRMGQCFSQTEDALSVPLNPKLVRVENDIEGGYDIVNGKSYCFSDGVGKISKKLSTEVHNALNHDKLCSAFQIRYGGCKGMLVTDPTMQDTQIVFRKSMEKFQSSSDRLEIAKTSGPIPLQLNRSVITLLTGLGVRHRMFLRLQEEMLKTLTDMLFDENEASKFLQSKTSTDLYNFEDLSKSGIYLTTDPFFKSLLLALHRHHIENIKKRANVSIDPSKGRNMLGVLDETNTLHYGQVFVQYSKDIIHGATTRETIIQRGEIVVTKNPCMHPGDIRKFTAVDVPALHHIVDCIVFPQRGPRPHPNEMAGSDLDGDEYFVLWDPDLIFYRANEPPAHFPSKQAPDVSYINVPHMIDFLENYIKNDHVGAIANAHLAWADKEGIYSPICKSIADKFSIAVDFAKNGESVQLDKAERPTEYPDFMENSRREMYKSKNALGKMYRVCKDFESENQANSIQYENIKVDPDLVYNGWEKYKDQALKARNKYNALFRSVLSNYGVQHEAEALSGAFTNLHCRFQERKDRNEVEKVIIGCIKKLNKSMSEEFMEEFGQYLGDANDITNEMLQKASAWYVVTYSDREAKFLSFPWCVSKCLVNIKLRCTNGNQPPFSPAIMNFDRKIIECESKYLLPDYTESGIWNEYHNQCDPTTLKRALKTLILWGQDEGIIERPGHTEGLLFTSVLVRLFFHVAQMRGYVTKRHESVNTTRGPFSAGHLILEFLKFCSTFRFYNPEEFRELLPFRVYKYSRLGKFAIVSYHKFALAGTFQTLNFDKAFREELIEMKSIPIDSKIFGTGVIPTSSLTSAEEALIKYSKVHELSMRVERQTKKVWICAKGTEEALKELKTILRKKHVILRQLFSTGIMPDSK